MEANRAELQKQLAVLDGSAADFWPAFAGRADVILDGASAEDYDWVANQLDAILAKYAIETRAAT